MASWDHRAPTGNGAYQMYLYVVETQFINAGPGAGTGPGVTQLNWELGFIKVGSSGGFASTSNNTSWEVHMQGNNNGDISGGASFSFGANDAVGTRRAIASMTGWTFSHSPSYDGTLFLNTMARAVTNISLGSPQIGWGNVQMTTFARDAAAPPAPVLQSRQSDTQVTIRAYDSYEWGLGSVAPAHVLARSDVSNMSANRVDVIYPTTGGGAAHDVVVSGLTAHKTYYFTDNTRGRTGNYAASGVLTVHARPSKPPVPGVNAKTTTSLTLGAAAPSYVGGGITDRQTQISTDDFASVLQTSTELSDPVFTGLTRVRSYKVRTRVKNAVDWSDWSDVITVTTPGTVPSAPAGYSVYDIAATSAKLTLGTLSDNGGAVPTQVRVKVSTTASDAGLIKTVSVPSWTAPTIPGLTKGTTYYVAEAAVNSVEGGGLGAYGPWVSFTTRADVPNAPVMTLDSASGNFLTLKWVAPTQLNGASITAYKVKFASNQGLTTNVQEFTVGPAVLSQVVTGLNPGTTYYASIWTETSNGLGSSSDVAPFATTGGGGTTSGIWLADEDGVMQFCEVWYSGADGVPRLCEVWYSGADGVPKLCVS
ncbi:minor tail protein [Microbacterium phage ArMaWen]|uniref:Minor tail protein n=1 Tax=Microbacterium phage ArMaWen TaxID=2500786 RepID=A0A3Q9RAK1_9CAUD|nr:minor tail protein [Microbacterium phage ArMaWen]WNM73247.1 minor tail protein [Microbacterium phage DumpQuist]